ncbi:MAG TPA: phytanoyl-CoA dioxygenase [Lentisphaeria bacterium]|nr:phytanoyl-CoA dioxygenase [Lentisphaeria bacterium]|tara:strand:- start:4627 stop:5433 length:807 start_codon:yes stop_codon:yes gene_type:complete
MEACTVDNMQTALAELGVHANTLTEEEKTILEEQSFLLLENLMDDVWLEDVRNSYEALMEEKYGPFRPETVGKPAADGASRHFNAGTRRWFDMVSEGEVFERMYTHPKVLAAVQHILKADFKLHSVNGRDALPGMGEQALHTDTSARNPDEPYKLVNSAWLLDAFTEESGPTRIVPGTHNLKGEPKDYVNPQDDHPEQRLVHASAGSVFIFNCHLWHSGTKNRSASLRRAIHCAYGRRDYDQQPCQKERIRKSTYDRLLPAARYLLDV